MRRRERRSEAAKRAAVTRARRVQANVYRIADKIIAGGETGGPSQKCNICGKGLNDTESIYRGIGSDCWQDVLAAIEERKKQ
jgi:hypothetical protein